MFNIDNFPKIVFKRVKKQFLLFILKKSFYLSGEQLQMENFQLNLFVLLSELKSTSFSTKKAFDVTGYRSWGSYVGDEC